MKSATSKLLGLLKPQWAFIAAGTAFASVSAGATALFTTFVGPGLKTVLVGKGGFSPHVWGGVSWSLPRTLFALALAKALGQWAQQASMFTAAQGALATLRSDVYERLLRWPPEKIERQHSGELLSRLTADVQQVEVATSQVLTSYVRDVLQTVALLVTCLRIDPGLFVLAFIGVPLAVWPVTFFAKAVRRSARKSQVGLGRLGVAVAEGLQNLAVVQAYDQRERLVARFQGEQELYLSEMRRSLWIRGAFTPAVESLGFVGLGLALVFGARAVAKEPQLAVHLLSFMTAALLMYQPLKSLSGTFSQVMQGMGAGERLFELLDTKENVPEDVASRARCHPLQRTLEFQDVHVRYQRAQSDALRGLSLSFQAGCRVAFVGASGAGKSTLFSVLLGFVPVREGRVLWDGQSLEEVSRGSLRAQLGWVPQEPILFSGSVRQNLLMGRPDASEQELFRALVLAHAEGFVRAFPHGLDEPVGERGARLSGGQRQRIAIARAALKEPSVLLLDEPTSALDAASESEVQAGLHELMRGRTTLVIAHRLSTVRDADLICVLDGGKVVETGTHASLTALGGRYALLLRQGAFAMDVPAATG